MTIREWRAHAGSIRRAWYRCEDRLAAERKKVKALRRQVWRLLDEQKDFNPTKGIAP